MGGDDAWVHGAARVNKLFFPSCIFVSKLHLYCMLTERSHPHSSSVFVLRVASTTLAKTRRGGHYSLMDLLRFLGARCSSSRGAGRLGGGVLGVRVCVARARSGRLVPACPRDTVVLKFLRLGSASIRHRWARGRPGA